MAFFQINDFEDKTILINIDKIVSITKDKVGNYYRISIVMENKIANISTPATSNEVASALYDELVKNIIIKNNPKSKGFTYG